MSTPIAIPFGVASAIVYGTSIVVQHRAAQQHAGEGGEASASGLVSMCRNPIFLIAMAGDLVGFLLQITALSLGKVVVVQPLVVLMLPVALAVSSLTGGHRPRLGDYLGVVGVLGGLAVFLALIGRPGPERVPGPRTIVVAIAVVLAVAVAGSLAVGGRNKILRGSIYGAAAGMCFGTLAVLVDAASDRIGAAGVQALFTSPRGYLPLIGILLCGGAGIALTQVSFQVGALGATLPASLAADPLAGVVLGVLLLHEHIPISAGHLVLYVLCLGAVIAGAIRLADPQAGPIDPDSADQPAAADPADLSNPGAVSPTPGAVSPTPGAVSPTPGAVSGAVSDSVVQKTAPPRAKPRH